MKFIKYLNLFLGFFWMIIAIPVIAIIIVLPTLFFLLKKEWRQTILPVFILYIVARVLSLGLNLVGIFHTLCLLMFTRDYTMEEFSNYLFRLAISDDQRGNVSMSSLFNMVLLKYDGPVKPYLYGDEDETISSVTGKNVIRETLDTLGILIDKGLNLFEKNHSIKSIEQDENIEKS